MNTDAVSTTDEAFASTFSINSDPKTPPHFFLPTLETAGTNSEVGSDNCEGSCAPIGQLIVNQTNSDVLSQTTDDLSLSCEHISSNGHMEIQSLQDKPQFSTDQNYHHLYRHSLRAHRTYCVTPKRLTNWYQCCSEVLLMVHLQL
ncbi:unnamed protein product [Protopolystoma xenopodis]|uniref:Uncharacterized protein n=1 Tax=Protopolystoma xenopodis TaxID=117903 RepID=A0A3S5AVP8_9PLAT|nr:unnamed protein product [Protopolystoma xenopodis]